MRNEFTNVVSPRLKPWANTPFGERTRYLGAPRLETRDTVASPFMATGPPDAYGRHEWRRYGSVVAMGSIRAVHAGLVDVETLA